MSDYFFMTECPTNSMEQKDTNDSEVWKRLKEGDELAFTELYKGNIRALYRYGMSLIPVSEAFVLDCIHDTFTEVWIKKERLNIPLNPRYYLLKALKVRILHQLQRQERPNKKVDNFDFDDLWEEPEVEQYLLDRPAAENQQDLLKKVMNELPPRQQEALRLRFVEEMNFNEIADILGINRQSAQNLVFRAMEKLRKVILPVFILLFKDYF
jgi:RNA polymerase sigma factor (sigma-70 family)